MGKKLTKIIHPEFEEVIEYKTLVWLTKDPEFKYDPSQVAELNRYGDNEPISDSVLQAFQQDQINIRIKGNQITYGDGVLNERTLTIDRTVLPKVVSDTEFIFQVFFLNSLGNPEPWYIKAANKAIFEKCLRNFRKVYRPIWVDESAENCFYCGKDFTIFRRQHHCRKCGVVTQAVCKKCTTKTQKLPDLAYKSKVRLCKVCSKADNNSTDDEDSQKQTP